MKGWFDAGAGQMFSRMFDRRGDIADFTLRFVLMATMLNVAFNVVMMLVGEGYPYTLFLWRPNDNFGDFFSLLHSYPGGGVAIVRDRAGVHAILPPHPSSLFASSNPAVTNFHMMPLSTIIDLGLLRVARWIDPVMLFLASFGAIAVAWAALSLRFAGRRREAMDWAGAAVISYPLLLTVMRGNLFAGLTALLVVGALLLGLARRAPVASAVLLAMACNFRPNAILFAAPLLLFHWRARGRFVLALGATGLGVLAASLAASTALYPAYHLASIRNGLANYYQVYVVQGWGVAFGSSLYGMARLLLGLRPGLEGASLGVSLVILAAGGAAWAWRRIDDAMLIFVATASYCLGSTVLGDYHLLVFIATPMALAATATRADPDAAPFRFLTLIASCLLLAPKNYLFVGPPERPISLQAVLNPAVLLATAAMILVYATRRTSVRTGALKPA